MDLGGNWPSFASCCDIVCAGAKAVTFEAPGSDGVGKHVRPECLIGYFLLVGCLHSHACRCSPEVG